MTIAIYVKHFFSAVTRHVHTIDILTFNCLALKVYNTLLQQMPSNTYICIIYSVDFGL
jgi:hypothetical protein